jgi:hypothetical protein
VRGSSTHQRCNARPDRPWHGSALEASRSLLAQYSIPILVAPKLRERLRVAASQLGLRRREIAGAIDRFLTEDRF